MSDIDTTTKKEGFFRVTWKEIIAGTLSLIILGAVTFVFTNFNTRLDNVEVKVDQVDIAVKTEIINELSNISRDLGKTVDQMTSIDITTRDLEVAVGKLEVLIERLEK